jgi:predicted secreted protein
MTAITGKLASYGAILKCTGLAGDNSSTYRNVANVTAIKGPGLSLDTADVTSHDSTDAWEEVVPTILRSGEVTVDIAYDPAAVSIKYVDGLLEFMVAKTLMDFKIIFNNDTVEADRTEWHFHAYVIGFEPDIPFDGALTASMKLKIASAPTLE